MQKVANPKAFTALHLSVCMSCIHEVTGTGSCGHFSDAVAQQSYTGQ